MRLTYGRASGEAGFDGRGDLNNDGLVTIQDFNLLFNNFGRNGELPTGSMGKSNTKGQKPASDGKTGAGAGASRDVGFSALVDEKASTLARWMEIHAQGGKR
jgi:hypothetical protein